MEIEPDSVVSSDGFARYGNNERCRVSKERVQDFLDRGLMSQDDIYQRYTEELSEKLISARRSVQPRVVEYIRCSYQQLCESTTGLLSEAKFKRFIKERLFELEVDASTDKCALLFDICSSHAVFPFPLPHSSPGQLHIDEDGFVRAICLLTLSPAPRHGPNFSQAVHACYSGIWGAHRGSYIALRGKDASDFRRRLFRSLAVRDNDSVNTSSDTRTMISVPRFVWYEPIEEESDAIDEVKQIIVAEDESETSIDVVDVLSECPPETDSLTMNPFRESYRVVSPSLPQHTDDLSVLFVPTTRLVELVKLVAKIQRKSSADLVAMIENKGSEGKIRWETFDDVMAEHSELLADGLSKVFGTFIVI